MKDLISIFLLLGATAMLWSCKGHTHHTGRHAEEVMLDNGAKWQANPETTAGIRNMSNLLNAFATQDDVTTYAALVKDLEAEYGQIFKNCTMRGEAHDQLHRYLLPMQDMFKGLASNDLSLCKTNFENLKTHIARYTDYFQ